MIVNNRFLSLSLSVPVCFPLSLSLSLSVFPFIYLSIFVFFYLFQSQSLALYSTLTHDVERHKSLLKRFRLIKTKELRSFFCFFYLEVFSHICISVSYNKIITFQYTIFQYRSSPFSFYSQKYSIVYSIHASICVQLHHCHSSQTKCHQPIRS